MKHMGIIVAFGLALVLPGTVMAEETPPPPKPCQSKQSIGLVKSACKKGGQKAAKKAMQRWTRKVKKAKKAVEPGFKMNCKTCHTSVKGKYPLTANGKSLFNKLNKWYRSQKKGAVTPTELKNVRVHLKLR